MDGVPNAARLKVSEAWATFPTGRTDMEQMALPFFAVRKDLLSETYTIIIFWMT